MAGALLRPLSGIPAARTERGKDGMIVLDYRDSRPLYEQVAERLRELMFKGALPQDAQLPSVRSLSLIHILHVKLRCGPAFYRGGNGP